MVYLKKCIIHTLCTLFILGSCNNEIVHPNEDDKKESDNIIEIIDTTLMTIANFENTFLEFRTNNSNSVYSIVTNPLKEGINKTRRCGSYTTGGQKWEFIWSAAYGKNFDFTANPPIFKIKVLAPKRDAKVYLKLESSQYPNVSKPIEIQNVVTTKEGEWEDLTFDFTSFNPNSNHYDKMVILFDAGNNVADDIWYFDEIRIPNDDLTNICLFKRWENNPILQPVEGTNDWMNRHIANAAIINNKNSIDGDWWMYARGGNDKNGSNEQIGVFKQSASTFNPLGNWVPYINNPVISNGPAGSYDSWRALDCSPVVGENNVTYLYYKARGADGKSHTACAYSTDGYNFTKLENIWKKNSGPTDAVYFNEEYYIFLGDTVYVTKTPLTTEGAKAYRTIVPGNAPSNFDDKIFFGNMIFQIEGYNTWFMAYQGSAKHGDFPDRFHIAFSYDLIHWEKVQNTQPFFSRGKAGEWDQCAIWFPEVIEYNGILYLYYEGWGKKGYIEDRNKPYLDGNSCVGVATCQVQEFINWCNLK